MSECINVVGVDTDARGFLCLLSPSLTVSTPPREGFPKGRLHHVGKSSRPFGVDFFKVPLFAEKKSASKKISHYVDTRHLVDLLNRIAKERDTWLAYEGQTGRAGGFTGAFTFARNYGHFISAIDVSNIKNVVKVFPQKWKKHFSLLGKPKSAAKEMAVRIAQRENLVLPSGRNFGTAKADAFLIAWYLFETLNDRRT